MALFTQTIVGRDYVNFWATKACAHLKQQGLPINKIEFNKLKAEYGMSSELQNDPELLAYVASIETIYNGLTETEKQEIQRAIYNPRLITMAVYKRMKELEKTDASTQEP